jgi:hypothetical protein
MGDAASIISPVLNHIHKQHDINSQSFFYFKRHYYGAQMTTITLRFLQDY